MIAPHAPRWTTARRGAPGTLVLAVALAIVALIVTPAGAQTDEERKVVYLSLEHAVALALRNNHDIGLAQIDPRLAQADELRALGVFDPTLFADATFERSERPTSNFFGGIFLGGGASASGTEQFDWRAGIRKRFATGSDITLQFRSTESEPLGGGGGGLGALFGGGGSRTNNTEFVATLTQPILRNFGFDANLADVRIARNQRIVGAANLDDQIRRTIGEVTLTYWDLVFAAENRELQLESLGRAERLLQISRAQEAKGDADALAVLQAQVEVARVQGEVLQSEQDLADTEDRLKRLIMPDNLGFHAGALLVPTEEPTLEETRVDLEQSIHTALEQRSDVLALRAQLETHRLSIARAKNQLLPVVNLTAAGGFFGLGQELDESFEDLRDGEEPIWRVGVEVEVPVFNRTARGDFDRARVELRRAQIRLDQLEKQVIVQVREAAREIDTSQRQITTFHQARVLAERTLEAETRRFEAGLQSSNKVLLDFQEDLTQRRLQELNAFVTYKKAKVNLEVAEGSGLRTYLRRAPLPVGYRHLED